MASNKAAYLVTEKAPALEVQPAPYVSPAADEILVKTGAVALNPIDQFMQAHAFLPVEYPHVMGHDVAGTVVATGSNVSRFKPGDRVFGLPLAFSTKRNAEAAFQEYVILQPRVTAHLPDNISFEQAAVIPLGMCTAAAGLFAPDYLALPFPQLQPTATGTTLLVWGAASSVGANAVQLARAAGCDVITTASPKNFELAKKLGARKVFDYRDENVVAAILEELDGKKFAGAMECSGSPEASAACLEVASKVADGGNRFVAMAQRPPEELPAGVAAKFVLAVDVKDGETAPALWERFLTDALAQGKYVPAPEPHVVGKGLESVQEGLDYLRKGVSAQKVVVSL